MLCRRGSLRCRKKVSLLLEGKSTHLILITVYQTVQDEDTANKVYVIVIEEES